MIFERRRREDSGVDLTPLIDVVFLLLIGVLLIKPTGLFGHAE